MAKNRLTFIKPVKLTRKSGVGQVKNPTKRTITVTSRQSLINQRPNYTLGPKRAFGLPAFAGYSGKPAKREAPKYDLGE